ncbi:MAG: sulfite exporter TauE/SafE family protein [Marinospirillum sp.]|uniref:sulfite exporter TauE/SafE family protein n=1 Tax=Marinospirillum sp. TaxID=2183934 RepID=UPI0019EC0690|nr:sulfite exporter TauE/SafE family protein [Marinospirillum sp.]MBE0506439.1 sulfite exporter TauE/SafE family protein [Marinospirillum sp.]
MTELLAAGLITALIAGLLGGGHCIGMCGGIVSALSFALPPSRRHPARIAALMLSYNIGRISSYILAGLLVGGLGQLLVGQIQPITTLLGWLATIMLVLMAFYIGQWWTGLTRVEALGKHLWRYLEPLGRRLMPVSHPGQALLIGLIWGWLPCGLVYSMLLLALSSGSSFNGGLLMLAFGLGTLPTLLVTGSLARQLTSLLRQPLWRQLSALLLLGFAIWQALPLLGLK